MCEDHYKYALSANIKWQKDNETRWEILVQPAEFELLCSRLSERSEQTHEAITVAGRLVGLDVETGSFHMTFPEGEDIKGRLARAFRGDRPSQVPGNYVSSLVKTTVIYYSTREDRITYELAELRQ